MRRVSPCRRQANTFQLPAFEQDGVLGFRHHGQLISTGHFLEARMLMRDDAGRDDNVIILGATNRENGTRQGMSAGVATRHGNDQLRRRGGHRRR